MPYFRKLFNPGGEAGTGEDGDVFIIKPDRVNRSSEITIMQQVIDHVLLVEWDVMTHRLVT